MTINNIEQNRKSSGREIVCVLKSLFKGAFSALISATLQSPYLLAVFIDSVVSLFDYRIVQCSEMNGVYECMSLLELFATSCTYTQCFTCRSILLSV